MRAERTRVAAAGLFLTICATVSLPGGAVGAVGVSAPTGVGSAGSGAATGVDTMQIQVPGGPGSTDPDAVRAEVEDVMARPGFQYEKSLAERASDWLGEQLEKLFPDVEGPGGSFGGGVGSLVAWVIIVLALGAVVAAIVYVVVKRVRRPRDDEDETETATTIEHRRSAAAWASDASAHERDGEWKEAIRARYRMLVRTLTDRRQLPDIAGRTTRELRVDLVSTTPAAADPFDTASLLFELPWYADVDTGPEENHRFREAAEQVLAAPIVDRLDGLSLGAVTTTGVSLVTEPAEVSS